MAFSSSNLKAQYHVRSISLPSRPHPLIPEFEEHLCRLRASLASSSSLSIIHNLNGLKDLHNCVDNLLLLPLSQQILAQHRNEKWVDELLDGSLKLLDVCSTAKDALLRTSELSYGLQSSLRRRQGGENGISAGVGQYLTSRKKVKKAMQKALRNLKETENKCNFSPSNKDVDNISIATMLKEVETVTLTVLESLLSSIAGAAARSKSNGWSLVSKLIQQRRVACEEAAGDLSEFEKVDAAVCNLISHRTQSINPVDIDDVQNKMRKSEKSIQGFEEGIEFLSRHLIKTRVFLLNILSH